MRKRLLRHKKIPRRLQPILWSVDVNHLDIERDKEYIIHQVLIYGRMEDIIWLFKTYPKRVIVDIFLNAPYKNYPRNIFYFVKNYLLGCKDKRLDEGAYVTTIHGPVRLRSPESVSKA